MESLKESSRAWTAARVKARLKEAFEIDRRLPKLVPGRLAPLDADLSDGRRALSFLHDGRTPAPLSDSPLLDSPVDPQRADETNPFGADENYNSFGTGFSLFKRGTKRAEAARKRDEKEELDRLLKAAVERCRADVTYWGQLCRDGEALIKLFNHRRSELLRWEEALGWTCANEIDRGVQGARRNVLRWLRSGQSENEFCEASGLALDELKRCIDLYCGTIAARLGFDPSRPISAFARGTRPAHLVFGLGAIATELGRTLKNTERMVAAGRIPVATFFGQLCAHRDMLKPYRNRGAKPKPALTLIQGGRRDQPTSSRIDSEQAASQAA
jgi:hypothetical protein